MYRKQFDIQNIGSSSFRIIGNTGLVLVNRKDSLGVFDKDGALMLNKNFPPRLIGIYLFDKLICINDLESFTSEIIDENLSRLSLQKFNITSINVQKQNKSECYIKYYENGDFNSPKLAKITKGKFFHFPDIRNVNEIKCIFYNSIIYFNEDYIISKQDLINVNSWQTYFKELVGSDTIYTYPALLEQNSKLYFHLGSDKGKWLFALDIYTGKEIARYEELFGFLVQDERYIYSYKYENILVTIDPQNNESWEWDVNELIKSAGFDSIGDHRCTAQDGKLYFTQTLGDNKAKIGILDTQKKVLLWKHEFEPKNGGIGNIQVSGEKIFVHTQDKTLHVFEKEIV